MTAISPDIEFEDADLYDDHTIFDALNDALFFGIEFLASGREISAQALMVAGIEALARDCTPIGAADLTVAHLHALADLLAAEADSATSTADLDRLTLARTQAAARLCIAFIKHPQPGRVQ